MKRIYHSLMVVCIAVISFKCQKELSGDHLITGHASNQSSPITSTLQGNVLDEDGRPAAGVRITVGSKTAITNAHGYFRITGAALDRNASLVTAEQPGYFKAYRTFRATSGTNQVVFKLIKKTLAGTVNAATGGEVTLSNGAKVTLPANGITNATGGAYTGNIQVYAAYIDPTSQEIGKTVPGSFMADDKDKNRVVLSSYGMLAVELESSSNEKLQILTGRAATLTTPIPSSLLSSAPASISLWYIDEQTGIWKEQGTAKKTGGKYVGDVKHFSYWNCDVALPTVGFSADFKAADGTPFVNLYVSIRLASGLYQGYAHGHTDSLGQASGLIPSGQDLVLEVFDECNNVVYTKNIGPFADDTDLGSFIIPNSVSSLATIKGKLLSCDNTPVTNGYAVVYWNNYAFNVGTDANGKFSTNIFMCSGAPQTFEVLGVDKTAAQEGYTLTIPFTSPLTDAGNIIACGISSMQYINYTLDGQDYAISTAMFDSSVMAYSVPDGALQNSFIRGYESTDNLVNFDFTSVAQPGVYALNTLSVLTYNNVTLKSPFNVTITAFPLHPEEYYEGTFTGSFTDGSAVTVLHSINGSFRIRKR